MDGNNVASRLLQTGGEFQRTGVTKRDPEIQALLSKLVADPRVSAGQYVEGQDRQRKIQGPDVSMLERMSETTATNIIDAHNLLQTLPDVEMAMQVTVSAIMSPKDLTDSMVKWRVEPGWLPSEVSQPMLDVISDYFDNSYKISERLPDILKDVLYLRGSRPILLLPESSIDHLINSNDRLSTEALSSYMESDGKHFKPLGFLANEATTSGGSLGLESLTSRISTKRPAYNPLVGNIAIDVDYRRHIDHVGSDGKRNDRIKWSFDPKISVVDNPQVLRVPDLLEKARQDRVHQIVHPRGFGHEAFDNRSHNSSTNVHGNPTQPGQVHGDVRSIYRPRQFNANQTVGLTRPSMLQRESVGHPAELHLPSECVIPVHVPSDPERHIGYFVLLDQNGHPLVKTTETDYFNEMAYNLKTNRSLTDQMISNVGRQTSPHNDWYSRQADVDEMSRLYSEIMEMELTRRLQNGVYGGDLRVARPQEVYQIMFSRALANMHTQLLFVPADLMSYVAFDYDQHGIGVSLLQKSKILGGLRAIMLYASIMAGIKNSIGNTVVDITLDEEDPDPVTSMETIMHEFAYGRSSGMMPLGTTRPRDIVNYMKQASVQYSVSGNPRLPTTRINVENKQNDRVKPDTELVEMLKKNHLNGIGVAPEMVDAAQGPDFATSVVANNLMFAKRVMIWQNQIMSQMQDHVCRFTLNSGILMERLREVVKDHIAAIRQSDRPEESEASDDLAERGIDSYAQNNMDDIDSVILDFLQAMRMELPRPDQASKRIKKDEFDNEIQMIETALKFFIDAEFLRAMELGEMESDLDSIIAGVKAHMVRDWMRNENIMPQMFMLTEMDGDEPILDMARANAAHVDLLRKSIGTYVLKVTRDLKQWKKTAGDIKDEAGVEASEGSSGFDSGSDDGGEGEFDESGFDAGLDGGEEGDDPDAVETDPDVEDADDETAEGEEAEAEDEGGEDDGDVVI